jgi:hypothetical protein
MTLAKFRMLAGLALLGAAIPAAAQEASDERIAERRLRACLEGGLAGAPRDSLMAAVISVRSLCRIQIGRANDERIREIDARFGLPDTPLSDVQRAQLAKARDAATRLLNDEVVVAVSNFTGLTQ